MKITKLYILIFPVIGQKNDDYNNLIEKKLQVYEKNKNSNFLYKIYNNFYNLLPLILEQESSIFHISNNRKNYFNNIFDYYTAQGLGIMLDINLYRDYIENFIENIKIEITYQYMLKTIDKFVNNIGITIRQGDIYKKIEKVNYHYKGLFLSKRNRKIFKKIFFILELNTRQKLIYIVGKPGTGKTTMVIDLLLRKGYTVYYLNGNNILLSDYGSDTIIQVLEQLKEEILSINNRNKVVLVFDECEVAFRDVDKLKKKLNDLPNNKAIANIGENNILKEIALTVFMLYMLSLQSLCTICIGNTTDISPYMERRITYLVQSKLDVKEYIQSWQGLLKKRNIFFEEDSIDSLIYDIALFSLENSISIRTIEQFTQLFVNKTIAVQELFSYCKKIEE